MTTKKLAQKKSAPEPKALEKIRPELNIEKCSGIWQPTNSRSAPKARIFQWETTLPNGSLTKARISAELRPSCGP